MDIQWTEADLAFQAEVRAFVAAHLPPHIAAAGQRRTSVYANPRESLEWQGILHRKGWVAPAWPKEHGGCGWTPAQRYIFARECITAGAPPVSQTGIDLVGHVIMRFGTPEQKAYFLPRTLSGEIFWCQGYSEPNSGSDLASLQMRAVEDGDTLVCTGTKTWTSYGHAANWIFCLVRTSIEDRPQKGITFVLIPMDTPGITVRPIVMMSGEHVQNEISFDNVVVPKANVVGGIGAGWTAAKYLLEFERGGSAYGPDLQVRLDALARAQAGPGCDTAAIERRIAEAQIRVDVLELMELRFMSAADDAPAGGTEPSIMKTLGSEMGQRLTEIALDKAGLAGQVYQPHAATMAGNVPGFVPPDDGHTVGDANTAAAPLRYLNDRVVSIFSGSNEVQRNIIAKTLLGG